MWLPLGEMHCLVTVWMSVCSLNTHIKIRLVGLPVWVGNNSIYNYYCHLVCVPRPLCKFRWPCNTHMWQSHIEIEDYSVAYFNYIATFEAPYCWLTVWTFIHPQSVHEPHPQQKLNGTALQTQQCNWNTWQNNLQFIHGLSHMDFFVHSHVYVHNSFLSHFFFLKMAIRHICCLYCSPHRFYTGGKTTWR